MKRIFFAGLLVILGTLSLQAATFTITPNTVSNNYGGLITIQMSGLPAGETVQVAQYFDMNNNGVIDAADEGVRFETVTDGHVKTIAGMANPLAFSDVDGATNGAITATMLFPAAPDSAHGIGNYFFRISSPANHFAATNLLFTVTLPAYLQRVQGTVKNNSTNVPFAIVALTQPTSGGDTRIIVGKTADASGNYSLPAPPGNYHVLAFRPGYVGDYNTFPSVSLAPNATITTNLSLIAADSLLSGSLVESTNTTVRVLPMGNLLAFSTNLLITIAPADSNGNFAIPVTSGNIWSIRPLVQSVLPQGYLAVEQGNEVRYQTFTGPVNNALIKLKHATAVLFGKVKDNHSNGIPAIGLGANADGGQYDGAAVSDGNGNFFMALDGGGGFIEVANLGDAPANNYLWTGTYFYVTDGQALNVDVSGTIATAHYRAHIIDDHGAGVPNLFCFANSNTGTTTGTTDANGYLDLPVFASTWQLLGLQTIAYPTLVFPDVPPFTIVDGVNLTNVIIARTVTGQISGHVRNSLNVGIPHLSVMVTNRVAGTNFVLGATTDSAGYYAVNVFDSTWNVSLDPYGLQSAGYAPVAPLNVPVPPANAIANFTPGAIPPPQILTLSLPDSVLGNYYDAELDATNGVPALIWTLDSGTLPGGLTLDNYNVGLISGLITNFGLFHFTVRVTDAKGQSSTQALSINVRQTAPGPLTIINTFLPNGAQGCAYTNQILASGGQPPYSWALAPGSDALPTGLNLGTDGTVAGLPTSATFANLIVAVSDSAGGYATQTVSLDINNSLEVFPGPLSGGTVGSNYFGGLYASGGQQLQTWTILSGSLPPGLTLDPTSGNITGTPTNVGSYNFTAQVDDGCATTNLATSITIYTSPSITTTVLPVAVPGSFYSFQLLATGGLPPYSFFTADPLPSSLQMDYTGLISGPDYSPSTNVFVTTVYDSLGTMGTATLTLISSSEPVQPQLDLPTMDAPGQFSFRVTGVTGQSYTAQYSGDLATWTDLYTTNAPAPQFLITDTNALDNRFYRVRVN